MKRVGRPKKIEVEILKRMPSEILLQLSNKEISNIFNVNSGQVSTIITQKLELYNEKRQIVLRSNEEEVMCSGAWMNSNNRKFYKINKL